MGIQRTFQVWDQDGAVFEAGMDREGAGHVALRLFNSDGKSISEMVFDTEEIPDIVRILQLAKEEVEQRLKEGSDG